jgi:hypothetical protein
MLYVMLYVDFVTIQYVLLMKYQSMSIWEFNLPNKATQLDWTSVLRIFTTIIADMASERGGGVREDAV